MHRNKLKKSLGTMEKIHFYVFTPHNALFKINRNDKAECRIITCSRKDDCEVYVRGECILKKVFGGGGCQYGRHSTTVGFTKKARGYSGWINKKKKENEGVPFLDIPTTKVAMIGEYVYLPYAHMDMNKEINFKGQLVLATEFKTQKCIDSILCFHPQTLFFNGEIRDYQDKSIPPV